jgi:hypothetical protein
LIRQLNEGLVEEAPSPPLGRIITFDDWMTSLMIVRGSVLADGLIAATDMAALATQAKMKPLNTFRQALFTAQCTGRDYSDR